MFNLSSLHVQLEIDMRFSVPLRIDEERTYQDTGFICCIVDVGADIWVEERSSKT